MYAVGALEQERSFPDLFFAYFFLLYVAAPEEHRPIDPASISPLHGNQQTLRLCSGTEVVGYGSAGRCSNECVQNWQREMGPSPQL